MGEACRGGRPPKPEVQELKEARIQRKAQRPKTKTELDTMLALTGQGEEGEESQL